MRKTHYDILGVARDATQDQIKSAYRNLAMKWHPDRWVNCSHDERMEAERRMKQINDAYEVLSDPERRSRYDFDLLAEEERIRDEKSRQQSSQRQASSRSGRSGSGDKAGSRRSPGSHHNQRCYQEPGYSSFNALGLVNAILKSKVLWWILAALVLKLLGLLWIVPAVLALGFVVILALLFI